MSNLIAFVLIAAVVAIPAVAVARASQLTPTAFVGAVKRGLSFDPRHPGLTYPTR